MVQRKFDNRLRAHFFLWPFREPPEGGLGGLGALDVAACAFSNC